MKISIIIPARNEEKRIAKTLENYCKFFSLKKKAKELDFEIIIAINNTQDRTEEIVKKFKKEYKEIHYLNLKPGGKGFAVTEGFKEALKGNSDLIGFVDADMATAPEDYYNLIKNIKDYDGIIGSRYLSGAVVKPKQSWQRMIASRVFNFIIRSLLFLPYYDTQCGAKIFKRKVAEEILPELKSMRWAFDVDLLYTLKMHKKEIKEFPTIWSNKEYSKINLASAGPSMTLSIFRLRLLNSPFKDFVRLYNKLTKYPKI